MYRLNLYIFQSFFLLEKVEFMKKKNKKIPQQAAGVQLVPEKKSIHTIVFAGFTVALITFFTFIPSLSGQFTNWDDNEYVTENPYITDVSFHGIATVATTFYSANYHPLTTFSYMAEYAVAKLNPQLYHIDNLLLHILNAVLLLLLIYLLTSGNLFVSIGVALLFALHPLRVESVAWVSERKDVLSGLWYILTLLMYTLFGKTGTRKWYWLSFAAFLLALLSKPMSVSLPLVLVLIDYFLQKKISGKLLFEKIPFVIFAALFCVITVLAQKSGGAIKDYPMLALWQRICVPFYAICFYLVKTIAPFNLSTLYYFPSNPGSALNMQLLGAPLLICGVIIVGWYKRLFVRPVIFGVLFFLATLLPVMQIIPVGNAIVADRYSYLPVIGVYFACMWGVWNVVKNTSVPAAVRASLIGAGCVVLLLFAVLSFKQCGVWHDSLSLWNHTITLSPCGLAYNNRAVILKDLGRTNDALEDLNNAIALSPGYVTAYSNRGDIYNKMGMYDEAMKDLNHAVALKSNDPLVRYNRGSTLLNMGHSEQALDDFSVALKLNPQNADAYNNRGIALISLERYQEALNDLNHAIAIKSTSPLFYNNRATANLRSGNINEAFSDYDHALALKPDYAEIYFFRGNAHLQINQLQQAIDDYSRAYSLKPDLIDAVYKRAQCYYSLKRYNEARNDVALMQLAGVQADPSFIRAVMQAAGK
jgi:Flp pilus assembly protein TadD